MNQPTQPKIDLTQTVGITTPDGGVIFQEGVILRKVSKFILGSLEDGIIPVPIMFDIKTGKILLEMLPKELREEFKDLGI